MLIAKKILLCIKRLPLYRTIKKNALCTAVLRDIQRGFTRRESLKLVVFNHCYDIDLFMLQRAAKKRDDVEILAIDPWRLMYPIARYYLPESATELKGYIDPKLEDAKKELRSVYSGIIAGAKTKHDQLVFLAPSDQFFWIREFVWACKEQNVPFMVQDKEGTIAGHVFESHSKEIKKYLPFISDYGMYWSESHRNFLIACGAKPEKLFVIGQPRSDYWKHKECWKSKNKVISELGFPNNKGRIVLYFDFDAHYYLMDDQIKAGMSWESLLCDMHSVIVDSAKVNPDINYVFKLHPQAPNRNAVTDKMNAIGLPNIKVVAGASMTNDLIANADLIIGFHSTAMLEAMLTDIPVVYAFWGGAEMVSDVFIPFHLNKGIEVVKGKEEFRQVLTKYIDSDFKSADIADIRRERKLLTDKYFYNPDGKVSDRVLDKIKELCCTY